MKIDLDKFRLQYISSGVDVHQQLQGIEEVLKGGCKWIQLRIKDENIATIKRIALQVKECCKSYDAIFIINDYVELAKEIDADGVHIGKMDMTIADARNILMDKIIGGTANTFEDILTLQKKVDYIGLGPYKWTQTKKKLSPIIGIDGYKTIFTKLKKENITILSVAIGGIELEDVKELLSTGVNGIAVGGSIYNVNDRQQAVKEFLSVVLNLLYYT